MNTNIKDIAILAGGKTANVCHGHGYYLDEFKLKDEDIQRFAEMLIKHCITAMRCGPDGGEEYLKSHYIEAFNE